MKSLQSFSDPAAEKALLSTVSIDEPWALIERFNEIVRESGTEEEQIAVKYITGKLDQWGIDYKLHLPKLLISLPRKASLEIMGKGGKMLKAKTPSFSISTGDEGLEGELVYISSGYAKGIEDIFSATAVGKDDDVKGKIAVTEGFPMPGKVTDLMAAGAAGIIFISPGERIHDGICTNIWGSPDLDSIHRKPSLPVVSVSKSDGAWLKDAIAKGPVEAKVTTELYEGWTSTPVIVAEVKGNVEPEKFLLFHGHLDSWHVGITDNATGNGTLLEVARVLSENQDKLKRSVRVAWWSGHSHGRYAGSSWYSDNFALDLMDNCIAHINCDSPGARGATAYEGVMWMKEFEDFCIKAIEDAVGQTPTGSRILRAGDNSFSNLGLNSFYMLTSSIPSEEREKQGLYAVGGSGGNNEWHHEDDKIEVADKEILMKDLRVFLTSLIRFANSPVLMYDYTKTVQEIIDVVKGYQSAAKTYDLSEVISEAEELKAAAEKLLARQVVLQEKSMDDPAVKALNEILIKISRALTPINFTRQDRFKHDPAMENPPVADLAPAKSLAEAEEGSDNYYLITTHLRRGANRVIWALREGRKLIEAAL